MMRLFINGLAASAGGGLTYLRNVIPQLARRGDVETTVALNPAMAGEFGELPRVSLVEMRETAGALERFLREQMQLPKMIRKSGAQILISAGNFALWNSPVPQILLSRNSLYTSADFLRDVRARGDYAIWLDTLLKGLLARRSIVRADVTVAPSQAFAEELTKWSGKKVTALHHGFDREAFSFDQNPLPAAVRAELEAAGDAYRVLFVSHYNYYRNFETLFRALPILSERLRPKKVKLFLTCRLDSAANPGSYRAEGASWLIGRLRSSESVVELGTVPYRLLHHLYRACHVYVSPAYAESFAHPLVEAMSSGLPVVASDLPVHREICGDAAVYFSRFAPDEVAERLAQVYQSAGFAEKLSQNGLRRSGDFRWDRHVAQLVEISHGLLGEQPPQN